MKALLDNVVSFLSKTLTSRKFWAAVSASVPFLLAHDWDKFAQVWIAYAGIQGVVDAADKLKKPSA